MDMLEEIKDEYILCNVDPNFPLGRRANLRYAHEYAYACLMELNPKGVDPFEYLNFAKSDISTKDNRGVINALGNAKRAIHLAIDCFFEILGLSKVFKGANFSKKLDIIQKLEAFPTNIIYDLNKERNYIEHEYKTVDVDKVINFVDIAEMFLRLCYPFLKHTTIGIQVGLKDDERNIYWELNPVKAQINIYENPNSKSFFWEPVGKIYYPSSEDRNHLKTINIKRDNVNDYLPYLNTLIYVSKREIVPKNPPYDPKEYRRLMFFKSTILFLDQME